MTMRQHSRGLLLVVATTVIASPLRLGAQQAAEPLPEMIPSTLVRAALSTLGSEGASFFRLTVGHPPTDWPAALLPPAGATIVSGFAWGPFRSIVVSVPRSAKPSVLDAMIARAHFLPPDTTRLRPTEGFASRQAGWTPSTANASAWCRDTTQVLIMSPIDSSATRRQVTVLLVEGKGLSFPACGMRTEFDMSRREPTPPLRVPALAAPLGAAVSPGGSSSTDRTINVSAHADTALSSGALLAHYTAELVRGGWTRLGTPALGTDAAVQSFSARDARGNPWRGALIVTTGSGSRDISITMSGEEPER